MGPHSFDPPHMKAHKHCILHCAEVEASTPCGCFYCFAPFAPTEISHMVGRNRHPLMEGTRRCKGGRVHIRPEELMNARKSRLLLWLAL